MLQVLDRAAESAVDLMIDCTVRAAGEISPAHRMRLTLQTHAPSEERRPGSRASRANHRRRVVLQRLGIGPCSLSMPFNMVSGLWG